MQLNEDMIITLPYQHCLPRTLDAIESDKERRRARVSGMFLLVYFQLLQEKWNAVLRLVIKYSSHYFVCYTAHLDRLVYAAYTEAGRLHSFPMGENLGSLRVFG